MRIIGLDINRVFAEAVALEDGMARRLGRVDMTREKPAAFAASLRPSDHVVVEATGKAAAVVEILAPKVARVAVANPLQVHLFARTKTKTDKMPVFWRSSTPPASCSRSGSRMARRSRGGVGSRGATIC